MSLTASPSHDDSSLAPPLREVATFELEAYAINAWDGRRATTLLHEPGLRWPDALAQRPDGRIYLTDSCIPETNRFKPGRPDALPTRLLTSAGADGAG